MKTIVTQLPLMGARIGNRPLRIGEFVPAAAMTARRLTIEDLEDPTELHRLYRAQCAMTRTLGSALPLETELKAGLTYRLRKINSEIARFEHTPEFDLPTLDPVFLSWKTQAGFPAFSIFRLDSDTMTTGFMTSEGMFSSRFLGGGPIPLIELIEARASEGKLFALYRQIEQEVAERAKILNFRKDPKPSQRAAYKRQVLASLAAQQSEQSLNLPQT